MDKKRIHEMLEKMTEWSLSEMQAKGKEGVDTKEMGEVIDMVKDLAEAEKAVWEKCYYECIVESMKEEEEEAKKQKQNPQESSEEEFEDGLVEPTEDLETEEFDVPVDLVLWA